MIHDVYAGFKIPYERARLALHFSATRAENKRAKPVKKKKGGLSIHPNFPLPLCLLVFPSESEPFTGSQAEWRSGAERHQSRTTLTGAIG